MSKCECVPFFNWRIRVLSLSIRLPFQFLLFCNVLLPPWSPVSLGSLLRGAPFPFPHDILFPLAQHTTATREDDIIDAAAFRAASAPATSAVLPALRLSSGGKACGAGGSCWAAQRRCASEWAAEGAQDHRTSSAAKASPTPHEVSSSCLSHAALSSFSLIPRSPSPFPRCGPLLYLALLTAIILKLQVCFFLSDVRMCVFPWKFLLTVSLLLSSAERFCVEASDGRSRWTSEEPSA